MNLLEIFKSRKSIWNNEKNSYDCFVSPQIPEEAKSNVRQNFEIGYNEKILFIRDTSFWNQRNQGLVITDGGIYCIPDNDSPQERIVFGWNIVKKVEYKDMILYFWGYGDENDNCSIHVSYFMKNSDDDNYARKIGYKLADLLSFMAQSCEPETDPFDEAVDNYNKLLSEGKEEEAFKFALSCKEQEGLEVFYIPAIIGYFHKKEYEKVLALCNEGLNRCEPSSPLQYQLLYGKYSAYHELNNNNEARKIALPLSIETPDDLVILGGTALIKEAAIEDFNVYDHEYVSSFLKQPYNKRKVLLLVNNYTDLFQDYLNVIDIKKIQDSGITFPIGHPIAYQLYVGHPYIAHKYLPFENYELELIEDKVREFCQIVQCLGATEISIECLNNSLNKKNTNVEQSRSGEVDYMFTSASVKNNRTRNQHLIDEISQSINLHQKFTPKGKPYLPDNLVWFSNEPSWQRLYNQRMQGTLQQHEERIETRKSRVLEGTELNLLEGEFKHLLLDANCQWNNKIEEKFELQENVILAIHVKFASLNNLEQEAPNGYSNSIQYTDNEKEYLEELRNCLVENGNISPGERRLLEKMRIYLNISEERAFEIEESLSPKFTDSEKEYMEEYKLCLNGSCDISAGEKRLLNKLREQLGISEERARDIEKIINNNSK